MALVGSRAAALLAVAAAVALQSHAQSNDEAIEQRLDALEAQLTAAEDIAAIKRLQRQYG